MSEKGMLLSRREAVGEEIRTFSPEFRIDIRSGLAVAHIAVRRGRDQELQRKAAAALPVTLPPNQQCMMANGLTVLCLAPSHYLALREGAEPSWSAALAAALSGCAAVTDQSGAFAILRLSGHRVRAVLGAGIFLDFHESVFPVGRLAATLFSHFNVIVWRLAGDSVFQLAVPRSVAEDLCRWLKDRSALAGPGGHST